MPQTLYEKDFYAWSNQQAELFKAKRFDKLDWENLTEEIEDMGKREKRELENRLIQLIMHMLKWKYQKTHRGKSWRNTIIEQRVQIENNIDNNPSLKREIEEIIFKKYKYAKKQAEKETDLTIFPEICEWNIEQILDDEFFPE